MIHAFDSNVAIKTSVRSAIILNHISWWILKNKASDINFHDGCYWTYNSAKAYSKMFPFWTDNVIQKELRKLEYEGYIKSGNYNKVPTDRTKWYALTEKGEQLMAGSNPPNGGHQSASSLNGISEENFSTIIQYKTYSNKHSNKGEEDKSCSPELAEALTAFAEHRKKLKKPMTDRAKELMLSRLSKMASTEQEQIAILNQSIMNGWQGVFPLGGDKGRQQEERPITSEVKSDGIDWSKYDG